MIAHLDTGRNISSTSNDVIVPLHSDNISAARFSAFNIEFQIVGKFQSFLRCGGVRACVLLTEHRRQCWTMKRMCLSTPVAFYRADSSGFNVNCFKVGSCTREDVGNEAFDGDFFLS